MAVGFLQATPAFAAVPELSVKDVRVTETDSGTTTANVRVVLSQPATSRVTAEYTTLDGTAKAADYVVESGTLVIPRRWQSVTIPVSVKGDELDERNEYFRFRISDSEHATIADRVGFIRVLDNDPEPYLDAGDLTVTEPASGVTVAKLPVALSAVSGRWVYVDYLVSAGSAKVDTDFYAAEPTGTLVFPPGTTSRSVSLVVLSDLVDENAESIYVTLYDPVHSYIHDGSGVATVVEDEPSLSVDDRTVVEGQTATFTVKLDRASNETVTVYYSTSSGTATSSSDFYSTSGYLSFTPGTTSKTVNVYTVDDSTSESTETFTLNLSNAVNADIADSRGTGTVTDNDGVAIYVNDPPSVTEGGMVRFTVYLSAPAIQDVWFDFATANYTATSSSDYVAASGNDQVIRKGHSSYTVEVLTNDDSGDEAEIEYFFLGISDIRNAKPGDVQGIATILDNDPTPTPRISIDDDTVAEGESAQFVVELSARASRDVTFDWTLEDGSATAADDFISADSDNNDVTIPEGETRVGISVQTKEDDVDEPTQVFYVNLSDVHGAALGDLEGVATVIDDDDVGTAQVDLKSVSGDTTPPAPLSRSGFIAATDVDWYKFTLTEDDPNSTTAEELRARVDLTMASGGGDLDLVVYKADGTTQVESSSKTSTAAEVVNFTVADDTSRNDDTVFVIKVFGKTSSASNTYTLTVTGDSS